MVEIKKRPAGGSPSRSFWRHPIWAGVVAALLLPAVAMQFTEQVAWGPGDFVFAAILLGGAAATYQIVASGHSTRRRVIVGGMLLAAVAVVWAQAAVGIF
ncbi:MAG: hypothetical protein ACU0E9_04705 [Limimaricola soesokkakensis]|uniref:hypothetical protein n=1 Tax=Limimaricola soesokkakensis TaxID=1343159 RepID=UPI004059225B